MTRLGVTSPTPTGLLEATLRAADLTSATWDADITRLAGFPPSR